MLNRHRSLSAVLLACAATAGAVAPSPAAAKVKPASAAKILKDCKSDGEISRAYRLADLKKARTTLNKKPGKYGECRTAVPSAIAGLSGKKGKNSANAVLKLCGKGRGAITQRFTAKTLQKALDTMPNDVRDYTACASAVRSQLNTVKKR